VAPAADENVAPAADENPAPPAESSSETPLKTEEEQDEVIGKCRESLTRIVEAITEDAGVTVEKNPERILFHIHGGNPAVLIGKRGQTLEAIQYLVEKIAFRQNEEKYRVQVDVEGYLQNRRDNLEKLALRLAQKAVRTGKPMTIGQMNSGDRRIVHMALKDEAGVRTQSVGEGLYRKLMILPRKKGRGQRPDEESKPSESPE
jgi:spoIIIJ-associated protein